jgi:hypothetical protein
MIETAITAITAITATTAAKTISRIPRLGGLGCCHCTIGSASGLLLNAGRAFSRNGRGERIGADTIQLSVRIVGGGVRSDVHRSSGIA